MSKQFIEVYLEHHTLQSIHIYLYAKHQVRQSLIMMNAYNVSIENHYIYKSLSGLSLQVHTGNEMIEYPQFLWLYG